MKRLANVVEILFLIGMLLLCGLVISAGRGRVPYVFGYRILQVVSGSMQPTIPGDTCILIQKPSPEEIQVGTIITFVSDDPEIQGYYNTHRVVEINTAQDGESIYVTQGDAYDMPDPYPVYEQDVIGIYKGELPFGRQLFRAIRFLTDRTHYFVLVIIPLLFCSLSYMKQLFRALRGEEKEES